MGLTPSPFDLPQLSHGRIHQWKARLAPLPAAQLQPGTAPGFMLIVRPDTHLGVSENGGISPKIAIEQGK